MASTRHFALCPLEFDACAYARAIANPSPAQDATISMTLRNENGAVISHEPSMFGPATVNARLFHFAFNRLEGINEDLVRGREDIYFGYQFAAKTAASTAIEPHAVQLYLAALADDPDGLRGSFGPYRALEETMRQNERRRRDTLPMPVLALGGAESNSASVGETMAAVADDLQVHVLDDCGHFPAEERPAAFLDAVLPFLRVRS